MLWRAAKLNVQDFSAQICRTMVQQIGLSLNLGAPHIWWGKLKGMRGDYCRRWVGRLIPSLFIR